MRWGFLLRVAIPIGLGLTFVVSGRAAAAETPEALTERAKAFSLLSMEELLKVKITSVTGLAAPFFGSPAAVDRDLRRRPAAPRLPEHPRGVPHGARHAGGARRFPRLGHQRARLQQRVRREAAGAHRRPRGLRSAFHRRLLGHPGRAAGRRRSHRGDPRAGRHPLGRQRGERRHQHHHQEREGDAGHVRDRRAAAPRSGPSPRCATAGASARRVYYRVWGKYFERNNLVESDTGRARDRRLEHVARRPALRSRELAAHDADPRRAGLRERSPRDGGRRRRAGPSDVRDDRRRRLRARRPRARPPERRRERRRGLERAGLLLAAKSATRSRCIGSRSQHVRSRRAPSLPVGRRHRLLVGVALAISKTRRGRGRSSRSIPRPRDLADVQRVRAGHDRDGMSRSWSARSSSATSRRSARTAPS